MNSINLRNITKIILIIAILFILIAQILPWMGFSLNVPNVANVGIDFYDWGSHIYLSSNVQIPGLSGNNLDIWSILYIINIGALDIEALGSNASIISTSTISDNILPALILILSFIFCLISILFGIIGIIKLDKRKHNIVLFAGIFSTIPIILFILGINLAFTSNSILSYLHYSFGFYLMIIATILFFIAFVLLKIYKELPTGEASIKINDISI